MRPSEVIRAAAVLVLTGAAAMADTPARVVSLNVCTDQLAMLLAAPGQLASVSRLARDPRSSAMSGAAADYPVNDGSAEAVVLQDPDLVLAGTFTTRETVSLLERLGYRVALFAPANSLDEARANMLRMGDLLGREAAARALVAEFDARRAALAPAGTRPRVALYYALGNTAGRETMPGDLLDAAGLDNIAAEMGLPFGGALPLETLLMKRPDMVLIGRPYGGHARATELLQHPALQATQSVHTIEEGAAWVCETPYLLDAVDELVALRRDWEAAQ